MMKRISLVLPVLMFAAAPFGALAQDHTIDGQPVPEVLAKFAANAPLAFIDQYIANLRKYKAIALDVGDKDSLVTDTRSLHQVMLDYGIQNSLEVYEGNHTSGLPIRLQNFVLPFFAKTLAFE